MATFSLRKKAPEGINKPELIEGRRGVLTRLLVSAVVSAAHGRLEAKSPGDTELIRGIATANIGDQLLKLPDGALDHIDVKDQTRGYTRRIMERALGQIQKTFMKLKTSR